MDDSADHNLSRRAGLRQQCQDRRAPFADYDNASLISIISQAMDNPSDEQDDEDVFLKHRFRCDFIFSAAHVQHD